MQLQNIINQQLIGNIIADTFVVKEQDASHKSIRGGNNSNSTLTQMVNPQAQGASILKYAFSKSHHNYLEWSEMVQHFCPKS